MADLAMAAAWIVDGDRFLAVTSETAPRACVVRSSGEIASIVGIPAIWEARATAASISPSRKYAVLIGRSKELDRCGKRGLSVLDLETGQESWSREVDWSPILGCGSCEPIRQAPAEVTWHGELEHLRVAWSTQAYGFEAGTGAELAEQDMLAIEVKSLVADRRLGEELDFGRILRLGYDCLEPSPDRRWVAWTSQPGRALRIADRDREERTRAPGPWARDLRWLPAVAP